ncbi:MAG: carbohydrate kinase family protein, partial [Clostridia bacterium]|nr:carbohydrate kinase family protein [Clostridia bacterium]
FGGRAGNSALALCSFGASSALCSVVGNDFLGEKVLTYYEQKGIDTRFICQSETCGTALLTHINAGADGKASLLYSGACPAISEAQLEKALESKPDLLLANLDLPFERVYFAVRTAREMGIPVVLDATNTPCDLNLSTLDGMEAVIADEDAVHRLTGVFPGGVDDCMRAALALSRCVKARYYILHLADRGCYLYDGRLPHFVAGYRTAYKDPRGAMEAFCAAICAALAGGGAEMNTACYFASAAYALTASKVGTSNAFPTLSEISYLMTGKA